MKRLLPLFLLFGAMPAFAAGQPVIPAASPELQKCLKRADDLPDMAAADAHAWYKKGGGNDAVLCHAFAQINRGQHASAAHEFSSLAVFYDKSDPRRAVLMHVMAGQEYLRAKNIPDADNQYGTALMIAPKNSMAMTGHAQVLMAKEKYWDAIDVLNKVLKADPKNIDALRQRGRAWMQLGNTKNAQVDFGHAAQLAGD